MLETKLGSNIRTGSRKQSFAFELKKRIWKQFFEFELEYEFGNEASKLNLKFRFRRQRLYLTKKRMTLMGFCILDVTPSE